MTSTKNLTNVGIFLFICSLLLVDVIYLKLINPSDSKTSVKQRFIEHVDYGTTVDGEHAGEVDEEEEPISYSIVYDQNESIAHSNATNASVPESAIVDNVTRKHDLLFDEAAPLHFPEVQQSDHYMRRQAIQEACNKYYRQPARNLLKEPPNILVNDQYKVAYCGTSGIAETDWEFTLITLNGKASVKLPRTKSDKHKIFNSRNSELKTLRYYNSERTRNNILENYTKFMFTRNPMARLVSVYSSQLSPRADRNRPNARYYSKIATIIYEKYHTVLDKTKSPKYARKVPTFRDFLEYLVSEPRRLRDYWNINTMRCLPCDVKYDVIGRFDNYINDTRFILNSIGAEQMAQPLTEKMASMVITDDILQTYFQNIPYGLIYNVYKLYELDFLIFGYTFEMVQDGFKIKLPPDDATVY